MVRSVLVALANVLPPLASRSCSLTCRAEGMIEHLASRTRIELARDGATATLLEDSPEFQRLGILSSLSRLGTLLRKAARRLFAARQIQNGLEAGFSCLRGRNAARSLPVDLSHGPEPVGRASAHGRARRCWIRAARPKELVESDAVAGLAMAVGQAALALPGYAFTKVARWNAAQPA